MDPSTAATLGGIVGLALGLTALAAVRLSDRSVAKEKVIAPEPQLPPGVAEVLAVLRSGGIVLDSSDRVVNNSPAAAAHGLVRGDELVHEELVQLARAVRRDGVIREASFSLRKGIGEGRVPVTARVAPLGADLVLVLVEDRSAEARVEAVRRDFVANVSHELKTPVGGIALLAEAIVDAQDDPEAVARFARRIQVESDRLTQLVREIVDLSRLQTADAVHDPVIVDVAAAVAAAVERCRLLAETHDVEVVCDLSPGVRVWGDLDLITTAVTNLVVNAVSYSDGGTRVAVTARALRGVVEIAVTDQGIGIPAGEQGRIFERFYRVDEARSRRTGGTGLGLAIVKHVVENHGGQISVWSQPGRGSTFTMRFPGAVTGPADGRMRSTGGGIHDRTSAAPNTPVRPAPSDATRPPVVNARAQLPRAQLPRVQRKP